METVTTKPDTVVTTSENDYDPIRLLRTYLKDNPNSPAFLANYLINRLGDQITWYDKKSGFYKRNWERYRRVIIVLSALIPFLVGLIGFDFNADGKMDGWEQYLSVGIKLFVGAAGVVIAVMEGFNSLFKSQELYVEYRLACSKLQQEFAYFLGRAGDYANLDDKAAYAKLISNAESLLANQNTQWSEVVRQKEDAEKAEQIQAAMKKFMQDYVVPAQQQSPVPPTPPTPPADNANRENSGDAPTPEPPADGGNG